jgi:predicted ribosomally synthesized peptide with nif11-like leader
MSQEDLTRFLEAVREDSSLQEKLRAEGADPVALAKEAGYSITQAELLRAHASHVQTLSDEELESAAGGTAGLVVGIATFVGVAGGAGYGAAKGLDAVFGD